MRQRLRQKWLAFYRRVVCDETGATTFEWTLLLAAIAIPSLAIIRLALDVLIAYYSMMTTMNALPLP
jgi:Flp pilus assembly pilin Flp